MKTKLAIFRAIASSVVVAFALAACANAEELSDEMLARSHSQIDYEGEDEFSNGVEQSSQHDDDSSDIGTSASEDFPGGDDESELPPATEVDDSAMLGDAGTVMPSEGTDTAADDSQALMPMGEPPESMTWETCDPAWATHFCPELDCETTSLCSEGQAMYEEDCRLWCSNILECVTARKSCIEPEDPLCIGEYFPRDKCIDYIDPDNEKSLGSGDQTNYKDSWGNKAAIALLECACGGQ